MKKLLPVLTMLIAIVFMSSSCDSSLYDSKLLLGSWKVIEWKIEETGQSIAHKMDMQFESGRNYRIDYGDGLTEKGKYWVSGEFLHTVETGKTEKRVKLIKLTADTMQFQMNRGGRLEGVKFIKKGDD